MKKLVFTALAVVVFSGVVMANDCVQKNEINDLKIENIVIDDPCKDE
jgi:opacity protein-like surface antigen